MSSSNKSAAQIDLHALGIVTKPVEQIFQNSPTPSGPGSVASSYRVPSPRKASGTFHPSGR